ncbi:MAG: type II secretion system F family protein [Patescibacteria group bacterium]
MATFRYTVKDQQGKTRTGNVEASTKSRAVDVLREQGFTVITLREQRKGFVLSKLTNAFKGVSTKDRVTFTRQLATMVGSGLPLTQALDILAEQAGESPFGEVLRKILVRVEGGSPLSDAMAEHPDVFPETYTALISAAEASGALQKVLERLATNLEKRAQLKRDVKGALFYPAIILGAMFLVGGLLLIFVLPKLKDMYSSFDASLPLVTQLFLSLSDFLVTFWWLVPIMGIGGFLGVKSLLATERGQRLWAEVSLKLPIFGLLVKRLTLVEITRTLSLLLVSGVPILDALDIAADSSGNLLFKEALVEARNQVERGEALADPLHTSKVFPSIVARMVMVGEESGELGEVLNKLALYFEGEANHTIDNLTTALEPIIMLILGVGVGFMIISIIMPIYNLTSMF